MKNAVEVYGNMEKSKLAKYKLVVLLVTVADYRKSKGQHKSPNLSCRLFSDCFSFHLLLPTTTNTSSQAENKTCLAHAVDETAVVHFQLWGDECDAFEPGNIVHLSNGIFSYVRSKLLLRAGKRGKIQKVGA
ncbi:hypothetical protein ACFX1X_031585 [Malus domestica]